MSRSIKVKYYTNEITEGQQGYPLRIVASDAVGMPDEIFVLQHKVLSAMDTELNTLDDVFIKVAEPNALSEYPSEPPTDPVTNPYYRVNEILLYCRCQEDLLEVKGLIDDGIRGLIRALKAQDNMTAVEEIIYE